MDGMGERLRRARIAAGYETASEAARAFGFSIPTFLSHENDSRKISRAAALRYARAFHMDPGYFLYGREASTKEVRKMGLIDPAAMTLVNRLAFQEAGLLPTNARNYAQALTGAARTLSGLPEGELTEDRARDLVESLAAAFALPKQQSES